MVHMTKFRCLIVAVLLAGCADPEENPRIVPHVTSECGPAQRLVTDVCTALGSDDRCVEVDDACVPLCDGATSCTTVGDTLRVVRPWPVAPSGYCVPCVAP
jgi:hypothetical protein